MDSCGCERLDDHENNINRLQFAAGQRWSFRMKTATFLRVQYNIIYSCVQRALKIIINITGRNGSVKMLCLRWRYQCLNGCCNEPFCTILILSNITTRMCVCVFLLFSRFFFLLRITFKITIFYTFYC